MSSTRLGSKRLLAPLLVTGALLGGCGMEPVPASLKPGAIQECVMPPGEQPPAPSAPPIVLKPDASGRYAQIPSPSKAARNMARDVIAEVVNDNTKERAAGVIVGLRTLVTSETILAGANDATDLVVKGRSGSATVYQVCAMPEFNLVKIDFGRTMSQGAQSIPLAPQAAVPGESVLAGLSNKGDVLTVGSLMLNDAILTGIDATSRANNGMDINVAAGAGIGTIMSADGTHLEGLLTGQNNEVSDEQLQAMRIQLERTNYTQPTVSSALSYDETWRVVHAAMPAHG